MEIQDGTRLRERDRGSGKKDRDRFGRSKRRRGDRLMMMQSSREDGEDTSDESINDEDDEDEEDNNNGSSLRMLQLNPSSSLTSSSSLSNHHRKSFPPPAKTFRPVPPTTWKAADEMIGVSVPRKARSGVYTLLSSNSHSFSFNPIFFLSFPHFFCFSLQYRLRGRMNAGLQAV